MALRLQAADNARRQRRRVETSAEQLMAADSEMTRPLAEYCVRKGRAARSENYIQYEFANLTRPDSLVLMPLRVVTARWLEAQDERYQVPRSSRGSAIERRAEA